MKPRNEKKTATVILRLPDEMKKKIKEQAVKRGISSGEAVRVAIKFFLAHH